MKSVKYTIEAYGIKGMKRLSWMRKFKDSDALCKWCLDHDAEVFGQRELSSWEQS